MIRVLHCVGAMNMGGIETMLMSIYRTLDRDKIQFDFLVGTREKAAYDDEIKELGGIIHYVRSRRDSFWGYKRDLINFFKSHPEYRIIQVHVSNASSIAPIVYAKKFHLKKIIIHSHSAGKSKSLFHNVCIKINQPKIKKYATHYFACSDLAAYNLFGRYIEKSNIKFIPNAIDSEKFLFDSNLRNKIKEKFSIQGKFVVGHVGRFSEEKNHDFLISVFEKIRSEYSNSILLLVGDGILKNKIEKKVKDANLSDNVIFTGLRSDVSDLLQAMDVFIFPSFYEGLPGTVIEAQTSGLQCIVSESITKECKVSNLVNFVSLGCSAQIWAKKALSFSSEYQRRNRKTEIENAGFDIKKSTMWFEEFYLGDKWG